MADLLSLGTAFLAGVLLGGLYFGLLWATTRALAHSKRPALLAATSGVLRILLLGGGLLVVLWGEPLRGVVALAGVIVARTLMIRRIRPQGPEAPWS